MRLVVLRLAGPLISFGGPAIDMNGVVQRFPARSMLTGLFANALGWHHGDFQRLDALQSRLVFAARIDRSGEPLVDYQTVDLGQSFMNADARGWTTRGVVMERAGASADGTHIRKRHYLADSIHTLAVGLSGTGAPSVDDVAAALRFPARPLFLGRKTCLPSEPILLNVVEARSPLEALANQPRHERSDHGPLGVAWFVGDDGERFTTAVREFAVSDERDWSNQVHTGRRLMREGLLSPQEAPRVE